MTDYISREVAFNALKDAAKREYKNRRYREKNAMDEARLIISHLPAAFEDAQVGPIPAYDVRPVVRGRWNAVKGALHPAETSAVCSNCGFATMIHAQTFYNFCPNCGADMREES